MQSLRPYSIFCVRLFLSALIVVVGTELGIRLVGIAPPLSKPPFFTQKDPFVPWKPVPGSILMGGYGPGEYSYLHKHNSLGFRDEEHPIVKPPRTYRILGVGDSFMYGSGASYEETFLVTLEQMLNSHFKENPEIEIIKAGVPRYFPEPERQLIEGYGKVFQPDMVLVAFNPNDVGDTILGKDAVVMDDAGYMTTKEAKALGRLGRMLYIYCHVFRTLWNQLVTQPLAFQEAIQFSEVLKRDGAYESTWRHIEEEYERIRATAHSLGAVFAVVYLPGKASWSDEGNYIGKRLRGWCESHNSIYIEPLPHLKSRTSMEKTYWPIDSHPNGEGYRLMAEGALPEIVKTIISRPLT